MDGLKPALGRSTRLKPLLGTTSLTRRPGWLHPGVAAGDPVPSSDFNRVSEWRDWRKWTG